MIATNKAGDTFYLAETCAGSLSLARAATEGNAPGESDAEIAESSTTHNFAGNFSSTASLAATLVAIYVVGFHA